MRWALILALLATPALARDGDGAGDRLRQALEQAIEAARREVDAPAPAPEPCFNGDDGPRIKVQAGRFTGWVPVDYTQWLAPKVQRFTFDPGNLALRVQVDKGQGIFGQAAPERQMPGLRPMAEGVALPDGRLDIGGGVSLLRGPDGAVIVVFSCSGSKCRKRWISGSFDVSADFDAGMLPEWPQIMAWSEEFLRCAFPAAYAMPKGAQPVQNR